jgi:hypothetical protein
MGSRALVPDTFSSKRVSLQVELLIVGRNPGVADAHAVLLARGRVAKT